MSKGQDILKIYSNGNTELNGNTIENLVWEIKDNILYISGKAVVRKFTGSSEITDIEELKKIEISDIEIRKTFFKKKEIRYVPVMTWYSLVERQPFKVMSNSFYIIDYRTNKPVNEQIDETTTE